VNRTCSLAGVVCVLLTTAVVAAADDTTKPAATIPIYTKDNAPKTPTVAELPQTDSVTYCGITWKFDRKAPVGRFVTGDYYVVGPVTVVEITPGWDGNKNGSVLNLPVEGRSSQSQSGFDKRIIAGRYKASLTIKTPVAMVPGDILISSIGMGDNEKSTEPLGGTSQDFSPVKSVSVLHCMKEPVPPDAFRPGYTDRTQNIYLARNLKRELLPRLKYGKDTYEFPMRGIFAGKAATTVEDWAMMYDRPWMDICDFSYDAPLAYMPGYGQIISRVESMASLVLALDLPQERKEKLLIGFLQYGVDLWGAVRGGYPGWAGFGGLNIGRKWPIVLAGVLLGDEAMASPTKSYPKCLFAEDTQTLYGESWTGAKVVFGGHQEGKGLDYWLNKPPTEKGDNGPYEHKDPSTWNDKNYQSESYRRCCTSNSWVGYALVIQLMHLEKQWDHDAFFDYVDRWMYEDNGETGKRMKAALEKNPFPYFHTEKFKFSDWFMEQSPQHTRDAFSQEMWNRFRPTINKPTDGWKKPHAPGGPASGPAQQDGPPTRP
jgi:hypothetical protein